jgi:GT2 family glycosyltransferase
MDSELTNLADLSIIIVSYNSWPEIQRCLAAVLANPPQRPFEVIIVDNASTDATVNWLRDLQDPHVRVLFSPTNDGYGVAINRGVEASRGKLLVFLNPDTEVSQLALERLATIVVERPGFGVVGPRLILGDGSPQPSARRFPSPWRMLLEVSRLHSLLPPARRARLLLGTYWAQDDSRQVDWVSGACHAMSRETWERVGPLTERTFCGFDDFDYCWRATESGRPTFFTAAAEVTHHCGVAVGRRWTAPEVDELAIHNMYVLLGLHWPGWRVSLYGLAEAAGAISTALKSWPNRAIRSRSLRQAKLLLALATRRTQPIERCEPRQLSAMGMR